MKKIILIMLLFSQSMQCAEGPNTLPSDESKNKALQIAVFGGVTSLAALCIVLIIRNWNK